MSPQQAKRVGDIWLICTFSATLWLHWQARVDAVGTMTMVVAVGGPAISSKEAAELLADDEEDDDDERLPSIAMLLAATRWVVGLDLSRYQAEESCSRG